MITKHLPWLIAIEQQNLAEANCERERVAAQAKLNKLLALQNGGSTNINVQITTTLTPLHYSLQPNSGMPSLIFEKASKVGEMKKTEDIRYMGQIFEPIKNGIGGMKSRMDSIVQIGSKQRYGLGHNVRTGNNSSPTFLQKQGQDQTLGVRL